MLNLFAAMKKANRVRLCVTYVVVGDDGLEPPTYAL
jgi:hypothetical protein